MPDMYVKGEGGSIIPMDLPLPEGIRTRFADGQLQRVNADGTPYREPVEKAPQASGEGGSALTDGRTPRPSKSATKDEWIAYVVGRELLTAEEATALTKADLIELASSEPE